MSFIAMTPTLTYILLPRLLAQGLRGAMAMSVKALFILLLFTASTGRADEPASRPALPIEEGYWKWERTSSDGSSSEVRYLKPLSPASSAATQSPLVYLALEVPEGISARTCVVIIPSGTNQMIIIERPRDSNEPLEVFTGTISTLISGFTFSAELTARLGGKKGGATLQISFVRK